MKLFLKCILKNNLGDDLFILTVANRYKQHSFYAINYQGAKLFKVPKNLRIIRINNYFYRIINKICTIFNRRCLLDDLIMVRKKAIICLGGSVFMERRKTNNKEFIWYKNLKKDYYIIGANIGPVYTNSYLNRIEKDVMKGASDVCVRDRASFEVIKTCGIRWAPDIIFSLDMSKYIARVKDKNAVVSIINLDKKHAQMKNYNREKYRSAIKDLICRLRDDGYKVTLFSFCKEEGDENEINSILASLTSKKNIHTYSYDGDYDEALTIIGHSELVVGSRFHAVVLGLMMGKPVIPVIYNDKTRNLLSDITFNGASIDIENNIYPSYDLLIQNKSITDKQISDLRRKATKQFAVLDKVFK